MELANGNSGDFQAIRNDLKALTARHGGKLHIEEWDYRGDECLRVLITWKRPINRPTEAMPTIPDDQQLEADRILVERARKFFV